MIKQEGTNIFYTALQPPVKGLQSFTPLCPFIFKSVCLVNPGVNSAEVIA